MKVFALAAALVALLGLTACGGGGGEGGRVVWYSSQNPEQNEAVVEAFREQHPDIDVEVLRLVTGELNVRYAQERSTGSATADVVTQSDPAATASGRQQNWWNTDVRPAAGFPAEGFDNGAARVGILPLIIGFNTDRVPADQSPQSWQDLLRPELRGSIELADPRNVPAYMALLQIWRDEYGDGFLTSLAAQGLQMVPSINPGNEVLGSGGASVLVPNARAAISTVINAGAPVQISAPLPTTGIEYTTTVTSNAPNPQGAATFLEFLTSVEGQKAFNGTVGTSLRTDVDGTVPLPEGYRPLEEVLPQATANRAELLRLLGIE